MDVSGFSVSTRGFSVPEPMALPFRSPACHSAASDSYPYLLYFEDSGEIVSAADGFGMSEGPLLCKGGL
jgi:hypothetical protein